MSELVAVPDVKMPSMYVVKAEGHGGQVPAVLHGMFTTRLSADKHIAMYHNRPKPTPQVYKGAKDISNEEEANLFEQIKKEVEAKNNGEEKAKKSKNSD